MFFKREWFEYQRIKKGPSEIDEALKYFGKNDLCGCSLKQSQRQSY